MKCFLGSLPGCPTLISVTPRDICRFHVLKDRKGWTQVHKNGVALTERASSMWLPCEPILQNHRAIFHALGRTGEWDWRFNIGNPPTDETVKDYRHVVTMEQLQTRVQPKQAHPFFTDKLDHLVAHIEQSIKSPSIRPTQCFILARDQAFFKVIFF